MKTRDLLHLATAIILGGVLSLGYNHMKHHPDHRPPSQDEIRHSQQQHRQLVESLRAAGVEVDR